MAANLVANSTNSSSSSTLPFVGLNDPTAPTKLIASLVLFLITLICGYLPVRMILSQNYIQHLMFAGGGVLMATAFCHLIPEAHDNYRQSMGANSGHHHHHHHHQFSGHPITLVSNTTTTTNANLHPDLSPSDELDEALVNNSFNQHQHHHHNHQDPSEQHWNEFNVPYLEVTLCCGFFFMYLVEQLMVRFINNHTHEHPCDSNDDNNNTRARVQIVWQQTNYDSHGTVEHGGGGDGYNNNNNNNDVSERSTSGSRLTPNAAMLVQTSPDLIKSRVKSRRRSGSFDLSTTTTNSSQQTIIEQQQSSSSLTTNNKQQATEFYKFIRGLLIISAFGAHSIFDGVAIGSQVSSEKVWTIFFAISCHKLIIAAVVGLELFVATLESHLWTLVHLTLFSLMSPIGILLVVVAQNSLSINSNDPSMILLQSFATGTLLYIIFVEILQPKEDQTYERQKLGKSFSLLAGFAMMLAVLTLISE